AEYRLWLRADNADQRLTPRGLAIGCVGPERARMFHVKQRELQAARALAAGRQITPSALAKRGIAINQDGVPRSALELLAYPDVGWEPWGALGPERAAIKRNIAENLPIDPRYAAYPARQRQDIAAYRRDEALALPADLDYAAIGSLSTEVRQ